MFRRKLKERKAEIDAELEPLRIKEWHASEQCTNEFRKRERYCKEQREVLQALEDMSDPVFRNVRFSPDTIQAGFQFGTFKE